MQYAKTLWLIALVIISACASPPAVSNQEAIEIATRACKTPHLILVGEPQNIRTQLITLREADKLIMAGAGSTNYERPMSTRVWLVQMDGRLELVGGPPPPNTPLGQSAIQTPSPSRFGTCSVFIDARTGVAFFVHDSPNATQPTVKPYP
jgi:hypothetical protein